MDQSVLLKKQEYLKNGWINENSLEWYFINKYPPKVGSKIPIIHIFHYKDSEEFKNFQKNLIQIFYGLKYGFSDKEGCHHYKENDILKKEDVEDYLLNEEDYADDDREPCIVYDCMEDILKLEHNITPDNPLKIISEINEIKQNNPNLETIYDIQIEYKIRHISSKTIKKLYELKKKENEYKNIEIYMRENESLRNKNSKLEKENKYFITKNDKLKMISKWLNDNSNNINFKIGKELFDILTVEN